MKSTPEQEQIDRLLQTLGSPQMPPNLEQEILVRMNWMLQSAPPRQKWSFARTFASAVSLTAVLALGTVFLPRHWLHTLTTQHGEVTSAPVQSPQPVPGISNPVLMVSALQADWARPRIIAKPASNRRASSKAAQLRQALVNISYPAPPAPLSEQEKLLLVVTQKGEPEQKDFLNRNIQLIADQKEEEDFRKFLNGGSR